MTDPGDVPVDQRTASYDYALPSELIAQNPAERRDASRLLVLDARGDIRHARFSELASCLRRGDLLVANDTKVIPARFLPQRREGGKSEVLLLHPASEPGTWLAMVRPGKRVRKGDRLALDPRCGIEIVDWAGGERIVRFYGISADDAMARFGRVPLPPYITQAPVDAAERYQTVYATRLGSVAAPTAGLHFTTELIADLERGGVEWTTVTLDVGAGTFRPVSATVVPDHRLHAERFEIGDAAALAIRRARARGSRVVAVGTTALRTLEASASQHDGVVAPGSAWTELFIYPPYRFVAVDALITNFHLPRSSLLMLVAAFAGRERVLAAYEQAKALRYRFYSFGDAMFVERASGLA
ncbi:MAG TPA: tRNA preQ1(34) S-adenosylmethionine ribosyltransferase-isomerase QueA [Candidatus Eremiobacteraceae bacterium]|nr:tRNA preQ1(34) S-adenosylmethionine ribosyltransferase-isomerase QueA [Candidatus Eremiobacteraceae bacterium]